MVMVHSTKMLQKINACEEKHIICNIPLDSIACILTATQANEVAREHNLRALIRKSLAEKRTAIKSHICTRSCNDRVTLFKAVDKNLKTQQRQNKSKTNKANSLPKVGKKNMGKA